MTSHRSQPTDLWAKTGGCTPDEQLELDLAGAA